MSLGSRLSLAGALLLTALVGNLRGGLDHAWDDVAETPTVEHVGGRARVLPVGSEEVGQLIPAVYARDPAVRFVYDRHVSKWM